MAKSHNPHQFTASAATATTTLLLLYVVVLISQSSLSSSSRLLHDYHQQPPQTLLALTEPQEATASFGIALPSDNVNVEADDGKPIKRQPCQDHMEPAANKDSETVPKFAGKYRPLVLNILPKGTVTPSGPSKGTNDVKN